MIEIHPVSGADALAAARTLIRAHVVAHSDAHGPDAVAVLLASLPAPYVPPGGGLWLAWDGGEAAGCIALQQLADGIGEIKRMYVRPESRGRGVARALVHRAIVEARALGYERLRLGTLTSMQAAQNLYAGLGFRRIEPYRQVEFGDTVFYELDLAELQDKSAIPTEICTVRLRLRPWKAEDAPDLLPVLEANRNHLGPWIPARVAMPAPVPVLAKRLAGFAADFAANREWRFGMFSLRENKLLGEVALFPRSASARVSFADADRAEIGYWLRADETGRGFATEAAGAVLAVAAQIPRFSRAEIRCDARNTASASVAPRLGFKLLHTAAEVDAGTESSNMQLWVSELSRSRQNRNLQT
ncbi:MAG TPA: GNAT family N-acetyltransferase [Gemmatimonadaceae bacterium]|nr:GNAT family N-acetyltransferase [Gemmatimonadaceae bacterium]